MYIVTFQVWIHTFCQVHSNFPFPHYNSLTALVLAILDRIDCFETVFSTVNLFLLVNVLALRCSCVKLSLLNPLFVVIFQPTQIPLDIIHTKSLKEVAGGCGLLLALYYEWFSSPLMAFLIIWRRQVFSLSCLKKKKKQPHLIHDFMITKHVFQSHTFYLKSFGESITKQCQGGDGMK